MVLYYTETLLYKNHSSWKPLYGNYYMKPCHFVTEHSLCHPRFLPPNWETMRHARPSWHNIVVQQRNHISDDASCHSSVVQQGYESGGRKVGGSISGQIPNRQTQIYTFYEFPKSKNPQYIPTLLMAKHWGPPQWIYYLLWKKIPLLIIEPPKNGLNFPQISRKSEG